MLRSLPSRLPRPLLLQPVWASRSLHLSAPMQAQSIMQVGPQLGQQNQLDMRDDEDSAAGRGDNGRSPPSGGGKGGKDGKGNAWMPGIESALATGAGIVLLAVAGLCYHKWYKWEVLRKMRRAFAKGYDPVLDLASASMTDQEGNLLPGRVNRKEAEYIRRVVNGEISGEYLLLMGPKGVGKTSMIVDAMVANEADGCAMFEAHEDPEVVRLRLGKALDFEYNEDSFAGLFQRKDPREAGPRLDIERALAKLEKVAIAYRRDRGRPMVLVLNNIHFIHDDEEGHSLLHMLQQRAEAWAQAGVLTMIFNSDDFHVYRHMKKNASRMHVLSIRDLTPSETHTFLKGTHARAYPDAPSLTPADSMKVWDTIGGRMSYLGKVAKHEDVLKAAQDMVEQETEWLHHRLGLIPDHDDDVMDEQKVSSCSFLLFQEFARLAEEADKRAGVGADLDSEAVDGGARLELLSRPADEVDSLDLERQLEEDLVNVLTEDMDPKVSYRSAREIMTRPDYILDLDHHNIINVDVHHQVRPDSRLMLSVFRKICGEEDFQEKLDNVRDRVDEIESLHRTSELTVKDDNDLGGFLRLRIGNLTKEHEKKKDDDGDDDEENGVQAKAEKLREPRREI